MIYWLIDEKSKASKYQQCLLLFCKSVGTQLLSLRTVILLVFVIFPFIFIFIQSLSQYSSRSSCVQLKSRAFTFWPVPNLAKMPAKDLPRFSKSLWVFKTIFQFYFKIWFFFIAEGFREITRCPSKFIEIHYDHCRRLYPAQFGYIPRRSSGIDRKCWCCDTQCRHSSFQWTLEQCYPNQCWGNNWFAQIG